MARDDPHFRLRVPTYLRGRIAEAAKVANRSMNAEIVARLEASFEDTPPVRFSRDIGPEMAKALELFAEAYEAAAKFGNATTITINHQIADRSVTTRMKTPSRRQSAPPKAK